MTSSVLQAGSAPSIRTSALCLALLCTAWASAGQASTGQAGTGSAPAWTTAGPFVTTDELSIDIPLTVAANKLYADVELGGHVRRFVVDTGSPSMLRASLAQELGLPVVDQVTGKDAHGTAVTSDIVQADIVLGGLQIQRVPMFAAELDKSEASRCFLGDGVLGSEMLPLCAWQFDLQAGRLRCHTQSAALPQVKNANRQPLHTFGYPHTPYLDVQLARKAHSKAMLDTGSPGLFTLSPQDLQGAQRAGGVARTVPGYGSLGASLGGQAPSQAQQRAVLKKLRVADVNLGRVFAPVRESAPSLVGAALLRRHIVTLDVRSNLAYFHRYNKQPIDTTGFGFSFAFDQTITVGLVWDDTPAAKAGLPAGAKVTEINGAPVTFDCAGMHRALDATSQDTLELTWEGGTARLERAER